MKILIISSCTGEKRFSPKNRLDKGDFIKGLAHIRSREKELKDFLLPAKDMYSGQQHVRLMRGFTAAESRLDIELMIMSAGYGLIHANRIIAPYECTFQKTADRDILNLSRIVGIPSDLRKVLAKEYDLGLILLGESYLKACDMAQEIQISYPTLIFCGRQVAKKLPSWQSAKIIPLSESETRRFSCGLVALKGEVGARILESMAAGITPSKIYEQKDLLSFLENVNTYIPKRLREKNRRIENERRLFTEYVPRRKSKMLYFIPEWDDRVDPSYDFEHDMPSGSRNPYVHDVYAHEMYKSPNYDGILISKSVIEASRQKRDRIQRIGIHAHIRVPRNFPVMGDCGAFNYINCENPPYATAETIDFYEALDFDYGVSVDHLILPEHLQEIGFFIVGQNGIEKRISKNEFEMLRDRGLRVVKSEPISRDLFDKKPILFSRQVEDLSEAKRRWEITLKNSAEFIRLHGKRRSSFVPIAGCQGWDVKSQVEMFRLQQEMGYQYIALGGLVRSKTDYILEVLEGINRIRNGRTKVHIFGVARPEAIKEFVKQCVSSVDSARFLRQAWLSAASNYYAGNPDAYVRWMSSNKKISNKEPNRQSPWRYTAIRVPPLFSEGSTIPTLNARTLVEAGNEIGRLRQLEIDVINILHAYDRGRVSLDETMDAVVNYETMMGGDMRNFPLYRRTLEDMPWKNCPCEVCRSVGIDVALFRRNNRNRRRGFHNTWWFFQVFKLLT